MDSGCRDSRSASQVRQAVLSDYDILDTEPEPEFDELVALASTICDTPMAAVTLIDTYRQWLKARVGIADREAPLVRSTCAIVLAEPEPRFTEYRDIASDPRLAKQRSLLDLSHGFYAGVPLVSREGVAIGVLCVADAEPRPGGLDSLQRQTLRTLALQVSAQLELRRALRERDLHAAELEANHAELEKLASRDPLTGLGNRALFGRALARWTAENGAKMTLLLLDLDHFKHVNDSHGHEAGDVLLRVLATRLRSSIRADIDTVVRLGGDEFGVLLPGIGTGATLDRIIERIRNGVEGPFTYRDRQIDIAVTIGAAVYPDDAGQPADLIRHADVALYAGKTAGRGRVAMFEPSMLVAAQAHAIMLDRASDALANNGVTPFYQVKIDLRSGQVCGFEALLRLRRQDGGLDLPAAITAAFNEAEPAIRLGQAMLGSVAADMRRWRDQGLNFGRVSINASDCEINDPHYARRVLATLQTAGVPPFCLEVEVTEGVLLDSNAAMVKATMQTLVKAGVRIALDDFGTGYASLIHLARFPISVLKIDRSFVAELAAGTQSCAITQAILQLAGRLGIETVAEGIETGTQLEILRNNQCDIGQGFLFGSPVPASDAWHLLREGWRPDPSIWGAMMADAA